MDNSYRFCLREKKLVPRDGHVQTEPAENIALKKKVSISRVNHENGKFSILTPIADSYKQFDSFYSEFKDDVASLDLKEVDYIKMMKLFGKLLQQNKNLCISLCEKTCSASTDRIKCCELISSGTEYTISKLKALDSVYKQRKNQQQSSFFVEPIEKAIGLKWKTTNNIETEIPNHVLVQSTFQYVSILETLNCLFSQPDFRNMYMDYNYRDKHKCSEGVFHDFCCGSIHKSKTIFDDPGTIKLQLGTDDFEVCCAVKSKANIHKVCATYVQIRNLPVEYRSKLESIYLVALSTTINLKTGNGSYDNIAELVVKEIKCLESTGLNAGDVNLKGTLVNIAADNLGANSVFGFAEGFNASRYCRECECTSDECKTLVYEIKEKIRTKSTYTQNVNDAQIFLQNNKPLDYLVTLGVRKQCLFNELSNFHIIDNFSIDLMHDLNEGIIPFCIKKFFEKCVENRVITVNEIQRRIRDYNYSPKDQKYKPSLINIERRKLNQSASQAYCLMINMPFIFFDLKDKFENSWKPIETLLKCMTILYSTVIKETDVQLLRNYIHDHLVAIREIFEADLIPKHHFLTHYPTVIERMGPPIHMWTMRMESKHKVLTDIGKKTANFVNITKTMASKHQFKMCKKFNLSHSIQTPKASNLMVNSLDYSKYKNVVETSFVKNVQNLFAVKFVKYEKFEYRKHNFIFHGNQAYEIDHVLLYEDEIVFLCTHWAVAGFDNFYNSVVIEKNESGIESLHVLRHNELLNKVSYEKKFSNNMYYISAESLNICSEFFAV